MTPARRRCSGGRRPQRLRQLALPSSTRGCGQQIQLNESAEDTASGGGAPPYDLLVRTPAAKRQEVAVFGFKQFLRACVEPHEVPGYPFHPRLAVLGARSFMKPKLDAILPDGVSYSYVGREWRASPGEGYAAAHRAEQGRIVRAALDL